MFVFCTVIFRGHSKQGLYFISRLTGIVVVILAHLLVGFRNLDRRDVCISYIGSVVGSVLMSMKLPTLSQKMVLFGQLYERKKKKN